MDSEKAEKNSCHGMEASFGLESCLHFPILSFVEIWTSKIQTWETQTASPHLWPNFLQVYVDSRWFKAHGSDYKVM